MKKQSLIIILLFFVKLTHAQYNCFNKFERVFYGYSPYVELNGEEKLNSLDKKISTVIEYTSREKNSLNNVEREKYLSDTTLNKLLYKSGIFKYDSLGRLISYLKFDEKGNTLENVIKKYEKDSIVRIICDNQGNFKVMEVYKLQENGLPETMKVGKDIKFKYYYNKVGEIVQIDVFKSGESTRNEYRYEHKDNLLIVEKVSEGAKTGVYTYDKNNNLCKQVSFNMPLNKIESAYLYSYNNRNSLVKEVLLNRDEYSSDRTYIYSKNGLLKQDLLFNKAFANVIVTEYLYYPNNDLKLKLNYTLNDTCTISGCVKYEYEYFK